MEINESQVIRQCQKGELEAFGVLYDKYFKKIYDFLYFRTNSQELAEDLTSQTFFKALEAIEKFDYGKGYFSAWLYRIAKNNLIDHYRSVKQDINIDDAPNLKSKVDVMEQVDIKYQLDQVVDCLDKLSEEQKEVVVMRLWDELSYREIAEIVGKSEASLKMMFSRTMMRLREDLSLLVVYIFILISQF